MNDNRLATQRIRARLEQLSSDLRLSYNVAQRHPNDQTARDRCVVEVVLLSKQIRRWARSLEVLRAEDIVRKAARLVVRADTSGALSSSVTMAPTALAV